MNISDTGSFVPFESAASEKEVPDQQRGLETDKVPTTVKIATLLRRLGVIAVLGSAAAYMIQGLDDIGLFLRNWAYLLMMLGCAGTAVLCRFNLKDAKSARVLMALAVFLIPAQFSQLGGMVHELLVPVKLYGSGLIDWLPSSGVTPQLTFWVGLLTALVAIPVAFLGFKILHRPMARRLTFGYLLLNMLLLLPPRESFAGIGVVILLAVVTFLLERAWTSSRPHTLESRVAQGVLLLPLFIAFTRFGFYVDSINGYCALLGIAALVCGEGIRLLRSKGTLAAGVVLCSLIAGAGAWWLYFASASWPSGFEQVHTVWLGLLLLPVAGYWLIQSTRSLKFGRLVRVAASSLILIWALLSIIGQTRQVELMLLIAAGALLGIWGLYKQYREPTLIGGLIFIGAVVRLLFQTILGLELGGWIPLALIGMASVLAASLVERYGASILAGSRNSWKQLSQWR